MFQFPSFASYTYVFSIRCPGITPGGFPHSEISGSKHVNNSPKLIAVFHVLLRLPMPRHPPSALSSLTINPDYFTLSYCRQIDLRHLSICYIQKKLCYSIIKDLKNAAICCPQYAASYSTCCGQKRTCFRLNP